MRAPQNAILNRVAVTGIDISFKLHRGHPVIGLNHYTLQPVVNTLPIPHVLAHHFNRFPNGILRVRHCSLPTVIALKTPRSNSATRPPAVSSTAAARSDTPPSCAETRSRT